MIRITFMLLLVLAVSATTAVSDDEATSPPGAAIDDKLQEGGKLGLTLGTQNPENRERFTRLVSEVAHTFHEVEINTAYGTNAFQTIVLNKRGKGLDGFRFRVPEGGGHDLVWMMATPYGRQYVWFVQPVEGTMELPPISYRSDFKWRYQSRAPWGKELKPFTSFVQGIAKDGLFEPGREYVLWVAIQGTEPMKTYVGVNLLRPGKPLSSGTEWELAMGFDLERH